MAHESSRAFRELIRSEANRKRLQYDEYLKVDPVLPPSHVRLLEELERRDQVRAAEQATATLYGPTALRSKARP